MMKTIVEINSTNYASTGNIMLNIAEEARKEGFNVYTCCKASKESYKYKYENQIIIGYRYERIVSSLLASITGLRDYFNYFGTKLFIKQLKRIKPDLIHLHVLHDDFINTKLLFNYLSDSNIPVLWTFHDCCAMTGKCPYFDIVNCDKWKNGCHNCPQIHEIPNSYFFDTTNKIWNQRKKMFTSLKNLTIITPSKWLSSIVKESFFKQYNTYVFNNGINLDAFKPRPGFFRNYKLENKKIVLGVANVWSYRKGIDVFIQLAKTLPENYQIVLVGTNDEVDKTLPDNIISIHRTYNQEELIKIYSDADVFVNPTREENFPTVNIEALASGLPIITFNTGGSPEILNLKTGIVVEKDDINSLINGIKYICENQPFSKDDCILESQKYDMRETFKKYIDLYKQLT